jgi:hypothetical protein
MYDIIFISTDEPNADENWSILSKKFLLAKRINGIKGIHQAHIAASKSSFTKMFWVVDGDARLLDTFNFDYQVSEYDQDCVHIFHSLNPINDLVYGYGAVKLLPRILTSKLNTESLDMTLSINNKVKVIEQVSNITHFNVDEFSTWRSAFRECVKLTLNVINKKDNDESLQRLDVWCQVGLEKPFGEYCIQGAREGKNYALVNQNNIDKLKLINDFDWLKSRFNHIINI